MKSQPILELLLMEEGLTQVDNLMLWLEAWSSHTFELVQL
jgi:hypothetical protein